MAVPPMFISCSSFTLRLRFKVQDIFLQVVGVGVKLLSYG